MAQLELANCPLCGQPVKIVDREKIVLAKCTECLANVNVSKNGEDYLDELVRKWNEKVKNYIKTYVW